MNDATHKPTDLAEHAPSGRIRPGRQSNRDCCTALPVRSNAAGAGLYRPPSNNGSATSDFRPWTRIGHTANSSGMADMTPDEDPGRTKTGWAEAEPRVAPPKGWYRDPYGIARYRLWTGDGWGQATRRRLPWLRAFGIALAAVPTLVVLMVMVGVIFLPEEGDLGNGNPTMHAIGSVILPVLGVAFFCALVALPASLVAWGVETIRLRRMSPPPQQRHGAHHNRSA